MSQRAIVTQAELAGFKAAVNLVAENLNTHINQSVSKAHGIAAVDGFVDGDGNDRTVYRNSNGDAIGTTCVRFVISGVPYYAPGAPTILEGQPASTGSLDSNPDIVAAVSAPSRSSLVTEYGVITSQQAINVNSLLLEHARLNHDQAHSFGGTMRVIPKLTHDSAGYVVGRYAIKFVVGGTEYEIPCDTRLGGPEQTPRVQIVPSAKQVNNTDPPYNVTCNPTILGGTLPIVFSWEYYDNGSWTELPLDTLTNVPFVGNFANSVATQFMDASTGQVKFISGAPGGDSLDHVRIRATVTNGAGSTTTDPAGNPLYFDFYVQDKASGCYLTTACVEYAGLPADCRELRVLRDFRDSYVKGLPGGAAIIRDYYTTAPLLVAKLKADPKPERAFSQVTLAIQEAIQLIDQGQPEAAFGVYSRLVRTLSQRYLT